MGNAEEVWPLLEHSPDPRLRSFIINWLNPLGVDPKIVAAEFVRLESAQREAARRIPLAPLSGERVAEGRVRGLRHQRRRVPSIGPPGLLNPSPSPAPPSGERVAEGRVRGLRHQRRRAPSVGPPDPLNPSPSLAPPSGERVAEGRVRGLPRLAPRVPKRWDGLPIRPTGRVRSPPHSSWTPSSSTPTPRSAAPLILALGTYGPDALSPGERDPLIIRLLDLYKNDPDSGIHGAAEWTLRQWNEQAKLKAADAELIQLKDRGDRRWLVNSQGQTFALIEGPVEFTMGSPPAEPDRDPDETPHRRLIPRRFAIAAKEATVEQYQKFASENPQFGLARNYLDKYSPEPDGPMIGVTWFGAVAYCNWLSKQEGLPEDQWCYLRNEKGEYDQAMTIPADVLKRKGYRLPTEAEWEYSCRAGAITSRYYGLSLDLLANYARYAGNSAEHAWPGGRRLPNDLGLFDMLGNVFEWCEDPNYRYQVAGRRAVADTIDVSSHVDLTNNRLLRGGSFDDRPAVVRSAFRIWVAPANRFAGYGFRPSRTYD